MPINSFLYPGVKVTPVFEVANSLRFNSGSSDYLTRTPSGTGNRRTWTFSAWVKRTNPGAGNQIFQQSQDDNNYMKLYFSSDKIFWRGITGGSNSAYIVTNRLFRDVSAWFHIVARFDSTNGTAGDRMRLYVNGVEETSFSTDINPSSNYDSFANTTNPIDIGRDNVNNASYFNGYMAEVCMVDGQSLDPTSFGEFDEDSGIWKPIDVSGLTFGTNGFYLDFEDSSALGNDAAGSNNFTVNNLTAVDQSTDTCTNNFATMNPLYKSVVVLSEGNLLGTESSSNFDSVLSTIGVSSGKWYVEFKVITLAGGIMRNYFGICDARDGNIFAEGQMGKNESGRTGDTVSIEKAAVLKNGSTEYSVTNNAANDIFGVYLDLDNGAVYFSKNGSLLNSGNPASGASKTGAVTITTGETYLFGMTAYNSSCSVNFGSPHIALSSANTDANGYGSFEYSPTVSGVNYYALNSKNLAEYG